MFFAGFGAFHDSGDLWDAHTGDDTSGADGARAHTDFDGVSAILGKAFGTFVGGHVTGNDINSWEVLLKLF